MDCLKAWFGINGIVFSHGSDPTYAIASRASKLTRSCRIQGSSSKVFLRVQFLGLYSFLCTPLLLLVLLPVTLVPGFIFTLMTHNIHLTHQNATQALDRLNTCLGDVKKWIAANKLKLNPDKTEFVVFGSKVQRALVSSRLDYCNSLFRSLPSYNMRKLQTVQNSLARVVTKTTRYTYISPVRKKLHWLPIEYRCVFKTALLVYKFLYSGTPNSNSN